ncbi:baseplate protein [bacterium]|nr:baseplate protein [Candidatus Elulimicrobium humile]
MALPMNTTPIYTLVVPSTKREHRFKPFVVKQEKALLIAMQSENEKVMVDTLKSIISDCVLDINVNELSMFDLEYIFCSLRGKSVGEEVELIARCNSKECETNDKAKTLIKLNIMDIPVVTGEGHSKKIPLFNDVGVIMKYPSIDTLIKLSEFKKEKSADTDLIFKIIADCIESIYDGVQMYPTKDQTPAEVQTFLDNLTNEQFAKIQNFFTTMPKLTKTIEFTCSVCNKAQTRKIEGLANFFS